MNLSEIRAEALKQAETCAVRGGNSGGHPRSIRKRGYHRALKRREMWALLQKQNFELTNNLAAEMYSRLTKSGTLFDLLNKEPRDKGAPLPLLYGMYGQLPKS